MDNANYKDVIKLAKNETEKKKVALILDEVFPGEQVNVPDPYYGGEKGFQQVFDMLYQSCEKIVSRI